MIDGGVSISGAIVLVLARERRPGLQCQVSTAVCQTCRYLSSRLLALSIFLLLPHPIDVAVGSEKTGESGKVT